MAHSLELWCLPGGSDRDAGGIRILGSGFFGFAGLVRTLPNLELHVTHRCNLACESCSHYSNHAHPGDLSLAEAESWMMRWKQRLRPRLFTLLGGEPTLHPELTAFVLLARRHWPGSVLRLVTNGFFLQRHPDLPKILRNDPYAVIEVSLHHDAPEYRAKMESNLRLLESWVREYRVRVFLLPSHGYWTRRYRGFGRELQPYADGNPRASWDVCPARTCAQLYEGRIWKCAPLAYLGLQDRKFGLGEAWRPYLGYRPLGPDCTDAELEEFFDREEESACGMCPASPEKFALPLPLRGRAALAERDHG